MLVARRRLLRQVMAVVDGVTQAAAFIAAYVIVGVGFHREFVSFTSYAWLLAPITLIWLACLLIWLACLSAFSLYRSAAYFFRRGVLTRLVQVQMLAGLLRPKPTRSGLWPPSGRLRHRCHARGLRHATNNGASRK